LPEKIISVTTKTPLAEKGSWKKWKIESRLEHPVDGARRVGRLAVGKDRNVASVETGRQDRCKVLFGFAFGRWHWRAG
jgi:hypothetical protein